MDEPTEFQVYKGYVNHICRSYIYSYILKGVHDYKDPDLQRLKLRLQSWLDREKDFFECFEPMERFKDMVVKGLTEAHFGDCNGMATTCMRCFAEEILFDTKEEIVETPSELQIWRGFSLWIFTDYIHDELVRAAKRYSEDTYFKEFTDLTESWDDYGHGLWESFESYTEFKEYYLNALKEPHCGDCTGVSGTCDRCFAEEMFSM